MLGRTFAASLVLLGWSLVACTAAPPATSTPVDAPFPTMPPAQPPAAPGAPLPLASVAPKPVEEPPVALRRWTKELAEPAVGIAIGKPKIAALTRKGDGYGSVFVRDAGKWSDTQLPDALKAGAGARDDLRLWFGRDDRPRLMGTRHSSAGASMVYLRFKNGWRSGVGEIGNLGNPPEAALFGILGHDDPEVVCKLDDICIIKRLTGWTMIPVPDEVLHVELVGSGAIAFGQKSALKLGKAAWERIAEAVPWKGQPRGAWGGSDGSAWVSVPSSGELFHFDGAWKQHPSPIEGPGSLWGTGPDDVWLAGTGGLAHYDGKRWRRDVSLSGPCHDVRGVGAEIYVAAESGVWRGTP